MQYRDILLHMTQDNRTAEKVAVAFALAKAFRATLTGLYTLPIPNQLYFMGNYVPPAFLQQQLEDAQLAAAHAKTRFEAEAKAADVAADWIESDATPLSALRRNGRVHDLVVIGQTDPQRDARALMNPGVDTLPGDLALALGRPVLVVPYIGTYPHAGTSVVIAWDGSREATRAVHDALPILLQARSVVVLGIDPTAEQQASAKHLIRHLTRYGIAARTRNTTAVGISVADALLSALTDEGVDLLVMGAYGHSRLRETVFGGVTATVLDCMTVPVLLSN